ncbi:hypothetical protein [Pedobacter sp. Leaf176]|uniref:hypothetical protein n=1 Tax=Pedobacter sp. Leaf176 TaxID=1736286 RepID=UPI0006FA26F5|nr:hypothetical protein [Pedobacter sp. Leaf176]KQR66936.1 hypothetical protein ASF92_19485 [Pedobacter sp. Leaf176]
MKRIKLNFAVVAFFLGSGAALASSTQKIANVKWGKEGTTYTPVTGAYICNASSNVCTRTYPAGQDPNTNPDNYISQELGNFVQ